MLPAMTTANVARALEELRQEYAEVEADVERAKQELAALETRHYRLGEAIGSLERLVDPHTEPEADSEPESESESDGVPLLVEVGQEGVWLAADSPIAKYVKRGGEGRRLSSASMVVDVLEELDTTVNRDEFKVAFFRKFPREDMEKFWERPDNALITALTRAARDKLIAKGRRNNGIDIYASLALAERIRQDYKDRKTASSNPDAEEEE